MRRCAAASVSSEDRKDVIVHRSLVKDEVDDGDAVDVELEPVRWRCSTSIPFEARRILARNR
jgi:hypothetical protein